MKDLRSKVKKFLPKTNIHELKVGNINTFVKDNQKFMIT